MLARLVRRRTADEPNGAEAEPVLTRLFISVLAITFLNFSLEHMMRPVVPLLILERGGSALIVGLIVAVHTIPSLLIRPTIGQMADQGRLGPLLRTGTLGAAITSTGVLLPGIVPLIPIRLLQGTAWAACSVGSHSLLGRLAPRGRRAEAAGYFMAMPALSQLIMPGLGVAVFAATRELGVAALTLALGMIAFILTGRLNVPPPAPQPVPAHVPRDGEIGARWRFRAMERSVLPGTLMITMFMSAQAVFTVFAPVYVLTVGAPIETLVIYYPIYGITLTLSQLIVGRISDRIGRGRSIRIGCAAGIVGIAIAAIGGGIATLAVGAAAYAVGVSLVSPTLSAITMDKAPADRLGAAMATYSLGYQAATGGSSLIWGALIATTGFAGVFLAALALQFATVVASIRWVAR